MATPSKMPYQIKIAGIDLNFEMTINTRVDLKLAEDVIEYVVGKVRAQVREQDQETVQTPSDG